MIKNSKEFLTNFIISKSRSSNNANTEIFNMIIQAANMDSRWKSLLHSSLHTAKTDSSTFTLSAGAIIALKKAIEENPNSIIKLKELTEDQITAMPINLKVKYKPFATYWEYLFPHQ